MLIFNFIISFSYWKNSNMDIGDADGDNADEENHDISNAQAESTRLDHSSVMDLTNIPNSQSQASSLFSQSQGSDAPPPNKKLKVKMSFEKRKS